MAPGMPSRGRAASPHPDRPIPRQAMVLAAGLGLRMRPLTLDRPKPLVELAGRPILDHVLDRLAVAGVRACVVNTHYLGHMIAEHLAENAAGRRSPRVVLSPEEDLLDTGGGIAAVVDHFGQQPFFAVNADILWEDGAALPALHRLADHFDPAAMDALLLVAPKARAVGYDGAGDFFLAADGPETGRLTRRAAAAGAPYVFTGVQILSPRLFADAPSGAFSLNLLYDRALMSGRLFGLQHDAAWYHVGTPEGLALADRAMAGAQSPERKSRP